MSRYVKLSTVCEFLNGGTPSRKVARYFNGDVPWITSADIAEDQDVVIGARFHITKEAIESSATKIVPKGNILLVSRTGVGKVAVTGVDICISQDFTGIVPDKSQVDLRYLFRFLQARKSYFVYYQRGATIKGITRKVIAELEIPLPALSEQKRIAAILDKADALRAKRRAALAKLDTLLQATFLDMFGDPVTNPMGWPIAKLGNLTSHIGSGVTPRGGSSVYKSDGYLFIRSQNVLMFDFDFSDIAYIDQETHDHMQRSKVRNKDVLLNITGASIGRLNYFTGQDDSANVNQHVCIIRPKLQRILSPYLTYHLGMPNYQSKILGQNAGATRQAFNYRQIREFQIMLPPIDRQQFFSDMVNKFRQLHNNHMIGLSKLNHLFYSLQHHAFKGEL